MNFLVSRLAKKHSPALNFRPLQWRTFLCFNRLIFSSIYIWVLTLLQNSLELNLDKGLISRYTHRYTSFGR